MGCLGEGRTAGSVLVVSDPCLRKDWTGCGGRTRVAAKGGPLRIRPEITVISGAALQAFLFSPGFNRRTPETE